MKPTTRILPFALALLLAVPMLAGCEISQSFSVDKHRPHKGHRPHHGRPHHGHGDHHGPRGHRPPWADSTNPDHTNDPYPRVPIATTATLVKHSAIASTIGHASKSPPRTEPASRNANIAPNAVDHKAPTKNKAALRKK